MRSRTGKIAAAVAALALSGCGDGAPRGRAAEPPDYEALLRGAPPRLAAVHSQANRLLDGGREAFEARLEKLRGRPVVVNKWASWCAPCRQELPYFQSLSAEHGKRVAFLGVDSNDGEKSARRFVEEFPTPYPSYKDPKLEIAASFKATTAFPATAFYDRRGRLVHTKLGGYASERELAADIRRYAR